ncbi:Methyltransferase domain-containing protein [Salinihabitans flavidus]|uniref:Methyltransferase domain-containing protein n=1 Tax=Salinihabitans flavidus TaxID=569882 RepID=A0A1H8LWK6_9RHOB|nr:methyltransferase domain-containing protein [Salinihabitans flavidus]SEO09410.1 Methyltransferase domain-containing protein [Salinihabitans flavidus]
MNMPPQITDRTQLRRNRARAQADALFLQETAIGEVQDRLSMVNREFTAPAVVTGFPELWQNAFPEAHCVTDDEVLPLQDASYDLVVHGLCLHWANDPVGQLIQCRRALRPDGLLICLSFGGQTLHELRSALAQAEAEITGGLSPRVAPMGELRELGALLQRAGYSLPVADAVPVRAMYETAWHLMRDLRAMGEGNALTGRLRRMTGRGVLIRAAEIYAESFMDHGRMPATFEIVVLTGWSPHASQPQPLRPGSASAHLADALGTRQTKVGN